jgi:uncharacterized protein (TIGR01777 family)
VKTILITGGSGFIGRHLCHAAKNRNYTVVVLTRDRHKAAKRLPSYVSLIDDLSQLDAHPSVDILVNLACQSLAEGRWTEKRKAQLIDSRVGTTDKLYNYFKTCKAEAPQVVISGSAVGFYGAGNGDDKPITENADSEANFSQYLCAQWEQSASQFESLGSRVCYLRTGIVLGDQGALAKMLPPFKLGLGGPFGNGKHWMPWIHIADIVNIILYCINETSLQGAINGTAPHPVRNMDFVKTLGAVLKRPAFFPMPATIVKLLFGQMGEELLLQGKSVVPKKLQDSGYPFQYTNLQSALSDIIQ